jgi:TatA/E family protein of Tat protein translocase
MGHIVVMDMVCASLAFIDGLGGPEMMLIFVIVLVLFGGQKLPEFARGLGKSIREFKKAAAGVEEEFKRALEEDERKNATPKLAAAATTPTPAADESYDHSYDPAGPESGVHSPVTDDVAPDTAATPEHVHPDEESYSYGEGTEHGGPSGKPAEEQKILPPGTTATPPAAPQSAAPQPKTSVPPPAASAPENPS